MQIAELIAGGRAKLLCRETPSGRVSQTRLRNDRPAQIGTFQPGRVEKRAGQVLPSQIPATEVVLRQHESM